MQACPICVVTISRHTAFTSSMHEDVKNDGTETPPHKCYWGTDVPFLHRFGCPVPTVSGGLEQCCGGRPLVWIAGKLNSTLAKKGVLRLSASQPKGMSICKTVWLSLARAAACTALAELWGALGLEAADKPPCLGQLSGHKPNAIASAWGCFVARGSVLGSATEQEGVICSTVRTGGWLLHSAPASLSSIPSREACALAS